MRDNVEDYINYMGRGTDHDDTQTSISMFLAVDAVADKTEDLGISELDLSILPHSNLYVTSILARELTLAIYRIRQLEKQTEKLQKRDDYQADVINTLTNRLIALEETQNNQTIE